MRINTHTSTLTPGEIRTIIIGTIKWCQLCLGVNNRRKNGLNVSITYNGGMDEMGGFNYKTNTLIIYYNNNVRVRDLVRTTIHEYTHYLQPVRKYYGEYHRIYGYDYNPMEKEAVSNENKHYKRAWRMILKSV